MSAKTVISQVADDSEFIRGEAVAFAAAKRPEGLSNWYCTECLSRIPDERRSEVPGCTVCKDCQS